ncbi:MAG: cation:proton antiporter [Oscillatoriales cyanobacterium C42_A2020_001]|nr:cation:proton antiporter [Leptolyngbyaceae cyanobacterium C42_A2020_001]
MEPTLHFFQEEPIVSFAVLLAVIFAVPPLFERIRLPGLVGLLAAGVVLGPNGLKLFQKESDAMNLLSDIGLVYLMFVAGLEIELEQFHQTKHRSIGFGNFTFWVPLIVGTAIGRAFNFDWNASFLIGSLLASHTLLAYPIVSRLGVVTNEAVTVTIGATIFTDIGALLVLAICVGVKAGDFSPLKFAFLIGSLAVYTAVVLVGINRLGKTFFERSGDEEGKQFLFVLLALFLASAGAQLIGVEKIVGAFLAGLAVNGVVGNGPIKEKIVFVGSVLFIPIFFVDMGFLINVPVFVKNLTTPQSLGLTIAIVVGLIGSKFGAALLAKLAYRYDWREMIVMWSLSLPQVAATLAATLVGFRAGILSEDVLNSVIVLMLVTSTLGPILTARFAPDLQVPGAAEVLVADEFEPIAPTLEELFTVIIPVYNPSTEKNLLELAALLAAHFNGRIVPLAIATARTHMDDPQLSIGLKRSQVLIETAAEFSREVGVAAEPLVRIDDSIAQGISRASREQHANLIVMGWGRRTGFQARLLGNVIDSVLWSAHCPVAISRLLESPKEFKRILVPIENIYNPESRVMRLARVLAIANQAEVAFLHVVNSPLGDRRLQRPYTPNRMDAIRTQLVGLAESFSFPTSVEVVVKQSDNVPRVIANTAQSYDLVILRVSPRHFTTIGLPLNDLTTQTVEQLTCSVIMLSARPIRPVPVENHQPSNPIRAKMVQN